MSSRRPNIKWSAALFICFVSALILSALFCASVFIPAWKTRNFVPVHCQILKILKNVFNCDCGQECISRFTCASVIVEFPDLETGVLRQETAVEEEGVYLSIGSEESECSYYPMCDLNQKTNDAEVEEYLKTLTIHESRICHVNKNNQWEVILNKKRTAHFLIYVVAVATSILVCQLIFLLFVKSIYNNVTTRECCRILQGGKCVSELRERLLQE